MSVASSSVLKIDFAISNRLSSEKTRCRPFDGFRREGSGAMRFGANTAPACRNSTRMPHRPTMPSGNTVSRASVFGAAHVAQRVRRIEIDAAPGVIEQPAETIREQTAQAHQHQQPHERRRRLAEIAALRHITVATRIAQAFRCRLLALLAGIVLRAH